MNESSAFNPSAVERLLKLGGQKFVLDMITLFGSYGGQKLDEARQALRASNLPALAAAAHPLKSSAGNVGAVRVQELAAQLEQAAGEHQFQPANRLLGDLEKAFAEALKLLELEKTKLTNPPS